MRQLQILAVTVAVFLVAVSGSPATAQIRIGHYDVDSGEDINESGYAARDVASGFTMSGTTLVGGLGTGAFTGFYHTTGWGPSQDTAKYISFTVAPDSGSVTFDRIDTVIYNPSTASPGSVGTYFRAIRSSIDGFASNIDGTRQNAFAAGHSLISFDLSALPSQMGTTEFRVYCWNTTEGDPLNNPHDGMWSGSWASGGASGVGFAVYGTAGVPPTATPANTATPTPTNTATPTPTNTPTPTPTNTPTSTPTSTPTPTNTPTVTPTPFIAARLVTGAGESGSPHARSFLVNSDTGEVNPEASFFAYDPGFPGGVTVAALEGSARMVTGAGAGAGGGPHVRIFDISNPASPIEVGGFFAYDPAFGGGVFVAVGDVNGDGVPDVVTGPGQTGGPHVRVFDVSGNPSAPTEIAGSPTLRRSGAACTWRRWTSTETGGPR